MTRLRERWVPLLAVAVVVSLVLIPAVPGVGVDGEADQTAEYSACVGPATASAGFGDMTGSFAEAAADCLAHYGITYGTSVGVYSPDQVIPRWQMALFLVRAASPAGIVVPAAVDQGFTDLDQLGSHTKEAINQLAVLGIMPGTTGTTFSPFADVTRQQMAMLLSRFLSAAPTGPGGADIDQVQSDDDNFRDLTQVPLDAHTAIRKIFEMGVTSGTSTTTFSPDGLVSRGQMAVFITRMLAHTNARPVGLTVQTSTFEVFKDSDVEISISLRDDGLQPFPNRTMDVFAASDTTKTFDDDGQCTDHAVSTGGVRLCEIDSADSSTDTSGNLTTVVDVGNVDGLRVWVWTGETGSVFDEDTTDAVYLDIRTRSTASALQVSDDLRPTAQKVQYGDVVTFTFQLVDDDGDPVRKPGQRFTVRVEESRDNGRTFEPTTITKETGQDGAAQLTFRHSDPTGDPGDIARLDLDVRISGRLEVVDKTAIKMVENDRNNNDPFLDWVDDPAEPTTLLLSVPTEYRVASSAGDGVGATVRAGLTDQFGAPVVGERISFSSSDHTGVPRGVRRTTNPSGVATLHYLRDNGTSVAERITGRFGSLVATARQFWAVRPSAAISGSGQVRVANTDENELLVVSGNNVLLIEYDGNDQFNIGTVSENMADFENDLSVGDTLHYQITGPDEDAVNTYRLSNR